MTQNQLNVASVRMRDTAEIQGLRPVAWMWGEDARATMSKHFDQHVGMMKFKTKHVGGALELEPVHDTYLDLPVFHMVAPGVALLTRPD